VSKLGGAVLQDAHSYPHDLRANAIARQQNNFPLFTSHFRVSGRTSRLLLAPEVPKDKISTCRGETV
jgi:hypothetical protein